MAALANHVQARDIFLLFTTNFFDDDDSKPYLAQKKPNVILTYQKIITTVDIIIKL